MGFAEPVKNRAWAVFLACAMLLVACTCMSVPAYAAPYDSYGDKVVKAIEMGGDEDNIRLAHAACAVSYSRRVWHGGGYDGTDLWMDVFHDTLPGNRWVRACEVNVAAIVRWTGIDPTYPVYAGGLMKYAKNSDKWDYLGYWDEDESKLLPGDILAYYGGVVNGRKITGLHVCMYVGEDIVQDVYKAYVKGTDGDVGKPVSGAKYVSAHSGGSLNNKHDGIGGSGAPCMDTARTSYARGVYHKGLYQIIRLKGAVSSEASRKKLAERKTVDNGVYRLSLASKGSVKLAVKNSSSKAGAPVQVESTKQRANQRWRFTFTPDGYYRIVNVSSGKSLSISGGTAKNKAKVVQATWKNALSQKWLVAKTANGYAIRSAKNEKYALGTVGGKKKSGTGIRLYKRSGDAALAWKVQAVKPSAEEGTFAITNRKSNLALSIVTKSGAVAKQVKKDTAAASQQWRCAYDEKSGYYTLQNVRSGKYLTAKGTAVKQASYKAGKAAQRWAVKNVGSAWTIRNALTGKTLSIAKGSKKAGAKAALVKGAKGAVRQWRLTAVKEAAVPTPPRDTSSSESSGYDLVVVTY